ncbi:MULTISPECIES: hypothetical protein [unclassified Corynebacterium]|uniref:hypothetical protein n=1 Tax=unclassified Corynebacterium TaxID=2624378 RepID=UPI0029CA5119|nr:MULTISPECIES: hypothetical protein [unclassified Corynebacterium]WPF66715.1 hypothetical protein OLX12_03010 [Corynebacterium sp. 22KM0430]WPF69203.1 hypothetical protein OLW90_03005 [Corynebacterium sp. 21KM1197]
MGPLISVLGVILILGLPPLVGALILRSYRRAERQQPEKWDSGAGAGWPVLFGLGLLGGVGWMIAWYSWGGGPGNQYPHWQVAASVICVVASVVGLGCWARWRISGPLVAAMGTVLGVCLPFGIHGAMHDDTGLWLAGLMFLEIGASVGLLLVSTAVTVGRHWWQGRRQEKIPGVA